MKLNVILIYSIKDYTFHLVTIEKKNSQNLPISDSRSTVPLNNARSTASCAILYSVTSEMNVLPIIFSFKWFLFIVDCKTLMPRPRESRISPRVRLRQGLVHFCRWLLGKITETAILGTRAIL